MPDLESVFAALDPMPPSRTPTSSSAIAEETFQSVVDRRLEVSAEVSKGQTVRRVQALRQAGAPSKVLVGGERGAQGTMFGHTPRRRTRTLGTVAVVVLITLGAVTTALVTRHTSARPPVHRPVGTSGWTVEPTPAIPGAGAQEAVLNGVACLDTTNCIAVGGGSRGAFVSDSVAFSLAERWDGSSWRILPTPRLPGGMSTELLAISCPSRNLCIAVGAKGKHSYGMAEPQPLSGDASPLVERWDGESWSVMQTPHLAGASLDAIACPSVIECIAVGYPGTPTTRPLAERWNGGRWSLMATPPVAGGELSALACPDVRRCLAVGSVPFAGRNLSPRRLDDVTFAMGWDGRQWVSQQMPRLPQAGPAPWDYYLRGLDCRSGASCVAVGDFSYASAPGLKAPLVESWNGTLWRVRPFPDGVVPGRSSPSDGTPREPELDAVACTSSSSCTAVGSLNGDCVPRANFGTCTLEASWNGASWRVGRSVLPKAYLSAVACVTADRCVAVGASQTANGTLAYRS